MCHRIYLFQYYSFDFVEISSEWISFSILRPILEIHCMTIALSRDDKKNIQWILYESFSMSCIWVSVWWLTTNKMDNKCLPVFWIVRVCIHLCELIFKHNNVRHANIVQWYSADASLICPQFERNLKRNSECSTQKHLYLYGSCEFCIVFSPLLLFCWYIEFDLHMYMFCELFVSMRQRIHCNMTNCLNCYFIFFPPFCNTAQCIMSL